MWTRHTERQKERERGGIHKQVDVHTQNIQHPALSHTASMKRILRTDRNDTGPVENYLTLQRTTLNLWRTTLT